jgi:imidazole glycerol phosphate synthase subunit hisH (EC 2.4.2.-)
MTKIAIIDYGLGNLRSVFRGIEKAGARPIITHDPDEIRSADGIILPGVGAFSEGMGGSHLSGNASSLLPEMCRSLGSVLECRC